MPTKNSKTCSAVRVKSVQVMIKVLQIIESSSNPHYFMKTIQAKCLFYENNSGWMFLFQEFVVKVF